MTTSELATRNIQIRDLKVAEIRTMMDVEKATNGEILLFIRFCQGADANPYLKEAYLIKYDASKPASIVLAIQWYVKRAASHPDYLGFQAGTLVKKGDAISQHTGAVVYPGEELFGAWCEVTIKGRPKADRWEIMYSEYNRKQAMWLTHPITMTVNTAIRQTFRRAIPDYYQEEQAELPVVLEGEFTELSPVEATPEAPPQEAAPPAHGEPQAPLSAAQDPPQRRFHDVTAFWAAVELARWPRERITEALGGSLGEWLTARRRETGQPSTWDDAFKILEEKLGKKE